MEMEYLSNLAYGVGAVVLVVTEGCRGAVTLVTLSPSRTSLSTNKSTSYPPPSASAHSHLQPSVAGYTTQKGTQITIVNYSGPFYSGTSLIRTEDAFCYFKCYVCTFNPSPHLSVHIPNQDTSFQQSWGSI